MAKNSSLFIEEIVAKVVRKEIRPLREEMQTMREEIGLVKERVNLLPTKEEFFRKMDEDVTELQTTRDEQTVMVGQISDLEDRVTTTA